MNFKEKVLSMSASDIIFAMVKALEHPPIIDIDMTTFGEVRKKSYLFRMIKKRLCFGCAATNTICQIEGRKFTPNSISGRRERSKFLHLTNEDFLGDFENSIDHLRMGSVSGYNIYAKSSKFKQIEAGYIPLPVLKSDYTNEDLKPYILLGELQREIELTSKQENKNQI